MGIIANIVEFTVYMGVAIIGATLCGAFVGSAALLHEPTRRALADWLNSTCNAEETPKPPLRERETGPIGILRTGR